MSNRVLGKRIKSFVLEERERKREEKKRRGEEEDREERKRNKGGRGGGGGEKEDFKWGTVCVCVWGGGGGGRKGKEEGEGGKVVHLLSNLVLLISVAQVSAQCLHPVSRGTCEFSECIGMYVSNMCTAASLVPRLSPLQLSFWSGENLITRQTSATKHPRTATNSYVTPKRPYLHKMAR